MKQVIGGNKRDVVDGQFEDPDDTGTKRLKMTVEASITTRISNDESVPLPASIPPQIPLAPSVSPNLVPLASGPVSEFYGSASRVAQAAPVIPSPMPHRPLPGVSATAPTARPPPHVMPPGPNGMHPWMLNPTAMAAWQHQQQAFMMGRMFAMMQQNPQMAQQMMPPPHMMPQPYTSPPGAGWMPPTYPGMPPNGVSPGMYHYPRPPPQQAQLPSAPPVAPDDAEVWRIPYSHNYHPRTGFSETQRPTAVKVKAHPEPPKNLAPLDEAELAVKLDFPLIKEDAEKQFGLKDYELTKKDVLCGRGGVTNAHPGNVRYRSLVDQYRWHYATVKKSRKSDVARIIVKKIREDHGRFLKKDSELWYEIGDEAALSKAAQTLREGLAKIYREGLRAKMEGVGDAQEQDGPNQL